MVAGDGGAREHVLLVEREVGDQAESAVADLSALGGRPRADDGMSTRKSPSVSARIPRCIRRRASAHDREHHVVHGAAEPAADLFASPRSKLTHSTRRCGPISRLIGLVATTTEPGHLSPSRPATRVPRSTPPSATRLGSRCGVPARPRRGGGPRRQSGSRRSAAARQHPRPRQLDARHRRGIEERRQDVHARDAVDETK